MWVQVPPSVLLMRKGLRVIGPESFFLWIQRSILESVASGVLGWPYVAGLSTPLSSSNSLRSARAIESGIVRTTCSHSLAHVHTNKGQLGDCATDEFSPAKRLLRNTGAVRGRRLQRLRSERVETTFALCIVLARLGRHCGRRWPLLTGRQRSKAPTTLSVGLHRHRSVCPTPSKGLHRQSADRSFRFTHQCSPLLCR